MHDIFLFIQNHWPLILVLVVVLAALIGLEFTKIKRGTQQISPQQAVLLINRENAVVADVRSMDAFITGHIVNAVSIPLANIESAAAKLEKFKSCPIVVACATGLESAVVATSLIKHGFSVQVLAGGIRAWKEADMPLVKGN